MEDVEIRVGGLSHADEVHERLEGGLLLGRGPGPEGLEPELPVGLDPAHAEQVLEARLPDERVALDVEEEIAGGRGRQRGETPAGTGSREELVGGSEVRLCSGPHLQAGLGAQLVEGLLPDARDPVPFVGGELGDGGDAGPGAELPDLVGAQPWHQGEVVVGDPPLVALRSPLADVAVFDRQRIRRNPVGAGDDEPCLGGTVVGGEVGQPERDLVWSPSTTWIRSATRPWQRASCSAYSHSWRTADGRTWVASLVSSGS